MSSTQTLSPGGEPQLGRPRFSSPLTTVLVVAHEGRHPMNMFPPPMVALPVSVAPGGLARMTTLLTLAGKGYSRGRCPVRRFPWMSITRKTLWSSTHNGNSPDSRLFASCSVVRLVMFPSSGGMGPVRLLFCNSSCWRLVMFPSSGGIGPLRLLLASHRFLRLDRFLSSGGRLPFRD